MVEQTISQLSNTLWEGVCGNTAKRFVRKNIWRFTNSIEDHDFQQELFLVLLHCTSKYSHIVTKQNSPGRHFMALFKTAMYRRMLDMMKTRDKEYIQSYAFETHGEDDTVSVCPQSRGTELQDTIVKLMLRDAPRAIRKLYNRTGAGAIVQERMRLLGDRRESQDEFLSRLAKLKPGTNIVQLLEEWVRGDRRLVLFPRESTY